MATDSSHDAHAATASEDTSTNNGGAELRDGVLFNSVGDPVSGFVPSDTRPAAPTAKRGAEPFAAVLEEIGASTGAVDPLAIFSAKELDRHDRAIDGILDSEQPPGERLGGSRRWRR
jgi:hypothetical protein